MSALISSIIASVLKIFENISSWILNKSKNTELADNQKMKKMQDVKDDINRAIERAHKKKDLEEVRKMSSE